MPIVVNVVTEEDYEKWVAEQKSGSGVAADDAGKT